MAQLLSMEGIEKSFFGVSVLKGVDFDLEHGEAHVLLGENGAGKSTLMKILSGAYTLDAGTITLEGRPLDLAAYDPATHDGSVESIVAVVMAWLATRKDAVPPVTPTEVLSILPQFVAEKSKLESVWGGHPPWPDIVLAAIYVAKSAG